MNNTDPTGMFGDRNDNYKPRQVGEIDMSKPIVKDRGSLRRAISVVNNPDDPVRQSANLVAKTSAQLIPLKTAMNAGKGILGAMGVGAATGGVETAAGGGDGNQILAGIMFGAATAGKGKLLEGNPLAQKISGTTDAIVAGVAVDAMDGKVDVVEKIEDALKPEKVDQEEQ